MRTEWLAVLLGALLAAAALADETSLLGRPLSEIRFASDGPIDRSGLSTLIALKPGDPVTEERLAEAKRLLELTEIFRRIDLRLEPDADRVALIVDVARRPVIHDVEVTGNEGLSSKEARRLIRLDKGTIYDRALVDQAQQRMVERYHRKAFVDAIVQVRVEPHEGDVIVHFDVEEGTPERIAAVVPEGDLAAWDESLQKRAKRIEFGPRTREAVAKTERKLLHALRAKGYYEARLHWVWGPLAGNRGILHLQIESGPRFVFRFIGNRAKRQKKLLRLIDLEQRLIVTDGTWRDLATRMHEEYQRAGYYEATVAVEIGEAAGGEKLVTYRIDEGRKYRIHRIVFDGNERLADRELRAAMETAPWHWLPLPGRGRLVTAVLNEDMKRLRHLYRTRGFPDAVVHRTRREVDERSGEITIVVPIEEGPQTLVRSVHDEALPKEVNRAALTVRAGAPLDPEGVDADRRAIRSALERDGHPAPQVEAVIDKSDERSGVVDATVTWDVEPGQRQRIGRLVVQHNVDTRSEAVLRELPFHEGDPLAVDRMLEGQVAVYKLGLFRSVSIEPIGAAAEPVRDVAVNVTEKAAGTLGFGGGYNTRDGIKAFAEVGYDNVGGMARRLSLRADASLDPSTFVPDQYLGNLGFIEPRLLDSPWRYKVNLIGERSTETVDKFSLERAAFDQAVDRKLWKRVQGGFQLEVERARVFDVKNDAVLVPEDEGTLRTVSVSPFLAYDGRDDPFIPTRGLFDSIAFRYSLPTLSDVQFAKFTTQHTQWIPLGKGVTFVYSARLGAGRTISGSSILPIRERFFLGGRATVRGFSENYIGPFGINGHEVGGDLSVSLNNELLVPLAYGFQLALFVDGGGLYLLQCDADCRHDPDHPVHDATFSFENFRRSAGLGLRYNTPVGPLALDYGIKLDRRDGETFGRLHFNIGTAF